MTRVAAIGLGKASEMFHVPALQRIAGVELVGGCDLSAASRERWHKATGALTFETVDEMLQRTRPDIVVVGTPPTSHVELCLRAIESGCHVFCEKPLAETAADADRIVRAAAAAHRHVSVNLEFREHPIFRAVKSGVASGRYGRLVFCQVWQLVDLPPWEEPAEWRARMADRALLEGGVHLVDLLIAIAGEPPIAVSCQHSSGVHDSDADAVQLVTLEFQGGRLGQITMNRLCRAAPRYLEVRADCEHASLRASLGGRALVRLGLKRAERAGARLEFGLGGLAWAEHGLTRTRLARSPRDATMLGTTRLLEGLIQAIADDRAPPSSAQEARDVLAVIEAAYESARTGARVPLGAPRV